MPVNLSPSERSLRARMAAHTKWAMYDPVEGTAKARSAFLARFEAEVDPDQKLPERERKRRAESARKAYFTRLAYKSAQAGVAGPQHLLVISVRRAEPVGTKYGLAALDGELRALELSGHRGAHDQVFKSAAAVGNLVAGGELDEGHARFSLVGAGLAIGRPRSEVERAVDAGLRRGRQTPRGPQATGTMLRNRTDAIEQLVGWWDAVSAQPWRRAEAAVVLKILAGVYRIAARAGKVRLSMSVRQISEAAGVAEATVQNRCADWERHVRLVHRGNRFTGKAAQYQLIVSAQEHHKSETSLPAVADCADPARGHVPLVDPAHNLWHRWATGWWLYCLLLGADGTLTASEIADVTGLNKGTVRRNLNRFDGDGIASADDDGGWTLSADRDADWLDRLGLDRRGERQSRHAIERDLHRRYLLHAAAHNNAPLENVQLLRVDHAAGPPPDPKSQTEVA